MTTLKVITKVIKYTFFATLLVLLVIVITASTSFGDLKAAAASALAGKTALEATANAAYGRNWEVAYAQNTHAQENINQALESLEKVKSRAVFSRIPTLRSQVLDLEYLLKTADIVSRSLAGGLPLAEKFDNLYSGKENHRFASLSTAEKAEFFKLIYESEPEINGLRANLELAKLNLGKINKIGVLYPIYNQISDLRSDLDQASKLLSQTAPIASLLPALAGYPSESEFLIIMHNNDELRPSGGFIGVFGLLKSRDGDIISLETSDSYHLDMPAVGKWKLEPPMPIKKYMKVENWYLRDANWSPDWPTSARQIQEIFKGETKAVGLTAPDFTGVIGITPDFVSDLLALVGPIEVRGETYTPDNLQPLLQYNVEVAYMEQDIASWDRKEVINELLAELKLRLFALDTASMPELLDIFSANMATKDVQIYFNNSSWQSLVYTLGADGAVKPATSDYLLVVDANLAAFKSDAVVKKKIAYEVNETGGDLQADLRLDYKHEGGFDWRTTRYRSYTRVFVPRDSELISIKALEKANLEEASITSYDDVALDKTVFGFFFSVEPGTTGALQLEYRLPNQVFDTWQQNTYSLLAQKQAGRRTESFTATLGGESYSRDLDRDITITK